MIVGLDTGFFVALNGRQSAAQEVWQGIAARKDQGVVSCLTLYELQKLGLKGVLHRRVAEGFVDQLPNICQTIWLNEVQRLDQAARLSHGAGLAMADALILASMMDASVEVFYTTDSDFEAYSAGPEIRML